MPRRARVGGGAQGENIRATAREGGNQVALGGALDGQVGKKRRMPEDRVLDAAAEAVGREAQDRGAVGEPGAGKLRLIEAQKGRQLRPEGGEGGGFDAGGAGLLPRAGKRPPQSRGAGEGLAP